MRKSHTARRKQETNSDRMEFAYWLKSMRESVGLTIQQVADELGIEKMTVARYEKGSLNRIKNKEKIIKSMQQLVKKEMNERRRKW